MGNENDTENDMSFFKCKWTFKALFTTGHIQPLETQENPQAPPIFI